MRVNQFRPKSYFLFFFFSALFFLSSCREKSDVPFIGINDQGEVVEDFLPKEMSSQKMGEMLQEVQKETLYTLEDQESLEASPPLAQDMPWELSRVDLGLQISMNLNFVVVGWGVTPTFILRFEKVPQSASNFQDANSF